MASLPHTPTSNTPTPSGAHPSPAFVETSREAGARFANRESTPPPSAVHHSFHPSRDIVSGSGFHGHGHPQQSSVSSNGRSLEETEQSPPGAFPSAENQEEREADAREEVKHVVTAIRVYAKSHLPASLGTYIGDTKEDDQPYEEHANVDSPAATPGESSAAVPEERKESAKFQSRSTDATGASHNTNPFRDPEFMRTHPQQPDISPGDTMADVSRKHMTSTRVSPETAHPSGYTDEPSASTSLYADTSDPPSRTYDVVRNALPDEYQDVSSGFGRSIRRASIVEPITTARAVPFTAEPPLVVYPTTSVPISVPSGQEEVETRRSEEFASEPSEHAPAIGASVQSASSAGTSSISDQEQSGSRDVRAEGEEIEESPREGDAEAKKKSKGLLSRLNKWFLGGSVSTNGERSEEESPTDLPQESVEQEERNTGQPSTHEVAAVAPRETGVESVSDSSVRPPAIAGGLEPSNVTPPTDIPSSTSRKVVGARPVRIAEAPVTSSSGRNHSKSTSFRRHTHPDIIPKNVPAHFDETIGPLPSHVEMRGKRELPTKEKPGGSRVGVGSLPGRRDEAGVARLPDERNSIIATLAASQGRAYDERNAQVMDQEGETDSGVSQQRIPPEEESSSSSSQETQEVDKPRKGFLSEFFYDAEEILRDLGDVALYYVPGLGMSDSGSNVGISAEPQPTQITQESSEESSRSPSPVAATTPTRAPPSSPVVGIQTDPRPGSSESTIGGGESSHCVPTTRTTQPSLATQFLASAHPDRLTTPMDPSSHPSRSSSAEEVQPEVFIVEPPSTRERISGKQEYIAPSLMREYVKSPSLEEGQVDVGTEGCLSGYPTEADLRALIGERMYDDQMRAAGATEPEETTTSSLTKPAEQSQESTATKTPIENQPVSKLVSETSQAVPFQSDPSYRVPSPPRISLPSTRESTTKGLDVKGLGAPVPEGQQGKKRVFSDRPKKSHN